MIIPNLSQQTHRLIYLALALITAWNWYQFGDGASQFYALFDNRNAIFLGTAGLWLAWTTLLW